MLVKLLKPDKQAGGHVTEELCRKSMEDTDWRGRSGVNKMADIWQTTFSNAFSSMEIIAFWVKFHRNLFLLVQLTVSQHWFKYWFLAVNKIYVDAGETHKSWYVTGELSRKSMEDTDCKGEEWGEQNGRHFQMHFHEWKLFHFDSNFFEIYPVDNNWALVSGICLTDQVTSLYLSSLACPQEMW